MANRRRKPLPTKPRKGFVRVRCLGPLGPTHKVDVRDPRRTRLCDACREHLRAACLGRAAVAPYRVHAGGW